MVEPIESLFPGLQVTEFRVTSPATRDYNCIAWAAGETARWWWPDADPDNPASYWPAGVPTVETVDAIVAAFATLGFTPGENDSMEPGFEKVAIFAQGGVPTHAARQLSNGRWTSKLGRSEDIAHNLRALEGLVYGTVAIILRRTGRA